MNLPPSPMVMGVLNVAPDPGGETNYHSAIENFIARGEQFLSEGAAIIDVSGESWRLGDHKTTLDEELDRVIPVVEILSKRVSIPISINTSSPEVMQAAVAAGARMINDFRSFTKPGALNIAAKLGVHLCLMHMQSDSVTMQLTPANADIVSEVYKYLQQRVDACVEQGIDKKRIIVDPGFGFGKNLPSNLHLLRSLNKFKQLGCLVMVGISNNSMIGQILDAPVGQRVYGGIAAAVIAVSRGADIIRTHDVKATVDAIKVIKAVAS